MDRAEQVATLQADIASLQAQKRAQESVAEQFRATEATGQRLTYDARFQAECAELSARILSDQIDQQLDALDALIPRQQRKAE